MLQILFISTILLLIISFIFFRDMSHPAFLFCLAFFIFTMICVLGERQNSISIGPETFLILTGGMALFLVTGVTDTLVHKDRISRTYDYGYIKISNIVILIVIIVQIIYLATSITFLHNLYYAYTGHQGSLSEAVNVYDRLTKFNEDTYNALGIKPGNLNKYSGYISSSVPYLFLFVAVNNFLKKKKINILLLISCLLLAARMLLSGGRSSFFLLLTMILLEIYIIKYRDSFKRRSNLSFVVKVIIICIIFGAISFLLLDIMGRALPSNIAHYIYIYFGAPVDNLDNYIQKGNIVMQDEYFGQHTFGRLYEFFKNRGIIDQNVSTVNGVLPFVKTENGQNAGNVFTMYYFFIIDFGYWGIAPLTLIMAFFYTFLYRRTFVRKNDYLNRPEKRQAVQRFPYALFLYTYLINHLIMSPFSNRFYEGVFTTGFVRFIFFTWLFKVLFIDSGFRLNNFKIIIKAKTNRPVKNINDVSAEHSRI